MPANQFIPSPNYTQGRKTYKPEAIVIHIMEGTLKGTDAWFQNPDSNVSAHFGIGVNGEEHQYVDTNNTAWHAGRVNAPTWKLIKPSPLFAGNYINPNYYTVGIEHEGKEDTDWTDAMYSASGQLIKRMSSQYAIPIDRDHIIGHHEIYSLKTCPGTKVDLNKLIALASGQPTDGIIATVPKTIAQIGKLTTVSRLNLRLAPNRKLSPVTTVEPNVQLASDGYTDQGESIDGNAKWYFTTEGNWFWSGAVK